MTNLISGEIPRRTAYETGFPGHVRRASDGQGWEPDPLILDERFISVHVKDKRQVVFPHVRTQVWLTYYARTFSVSGYRVVWSYRRPASFRRNGKDHSSDRRRYTAI